MKVYDLIERGTTIDVMSAGYIEKYFQLSSLSSYDVKMVKVYNSKGEVICLRYTYYPDIEHLNHNAEKYEDFISEHYERYPRT